MGSWSTSHSLQCQGVIVCVLIRWMVPRRRRKRVQVVSPLARKSWRRDWHHWPKLKLLRQWNLIIKLCLKYLVFMSAITMFQSWKFCHVAQIHPYIFIMFEVCSYLIFTNINLVIYSVLLSSNDFCFVVCIFLFVWWWCSFNIPLKSVLWIYYWVMSLGAMNFELTYNNISSFMLVWDDLACLPAPVFYFLFNVFRNTS